jgi:phosphoglycolate phosphatase-like HAD superfamily hydrolase
MRLLLWDIDYTLILTGGVDVAVWMEVCSTLSGCRVTTIGSVPGRTEPQILLDTLVLAGVSNYEARALLPTAMEMTVDILRSRRAELLSKGRVLSGAEATLAAVANMSDVAQSPVTGNLRDNAVLKLQTFGLARYLDLELGAYGSDGTHRDVLVRLAQERAGKHLATRFDRTNTVVVGDSPLDVAAGLEGGARPVAVATGTASRAELVEAGADVVLDDLSDPDAALAALLGRSRGEG